MYSDHSGIRLQTNSKRNPRVYTVTGTALNNMGMNAEWSHEELRGVKKKNLLEENENENKTYQILLDTMKAA